jgi:HEAT repeat protein
LTALPSEKKATTTRPAPKVLDSKEAAIGHLQEVSTTYDPAGLPQIQPYLENPDPDIRAAAVDAMIVLGDSRAGTMLREAAKKLTSFEESKKMEEAARYVELPSADIRNLFKSKKKTGL